MAVAIFPVPGYLHIRRFVGGRRNISANCYNRYLAAFGDTAAIIRDAEDPADPSAPVRSKTRSTDMMRYVLRKITEDSVSSLGDTPTPANPSVVAHPIGGCGA